jgi:pimeloyl-ACP methyl ester carboxylesterase
MTADRIAHRVTHRTGLFMVLIALTALVAVALPSSAAGLAVTDRHQQQPRPTIVLVHGAFADASGWSTVAESLQRRGYTVYAPPNPLRGLTSDAEYVKAFIATLPGPLILVGHSYGGAVITNAATGNPNVKALVYIAAYALDEGESVAAANELGGHPEESQLLANVVPRPFPGAGPGDADVYINPTAFRAVFAADLPAKQTAFMAAGQRPGAFAAFATPSGVPAWRTIPSWYLVATEDHTIPPTAERVMAARANAHTIEIHSSHVAMMSHPDVTTRLILDAVKGS